MRIIRLFKISLFAMILFFIIASLLTGCYFIQRYPSDNGTYDSGSTMNESNINADYEESSQDPNGALVVDITEESNQISSADVLETPMPLQKPTPYPVVEQATPKPEGGSAGDNADQISWLITPDFINWDTITGTWKLIDMAPSPFYLLEDKTEREYAIKFCDDYIDYINYTAGENPGYEYRILFRSDGLCATYDIPNSVEPTMWYWCCLNDLNKIDMILYEDASTEWTQDNLDKFRMFSSGDYTRNGSNIYLAGEEHYCQVIYFYDGYIFRSRKFMYNYYAFEVYEKISEIEYVYGY